MFVLKTARPMFLSRAIYTLLFLLCFSMTGSAQELFEEPDGKFTIELPNGWIAFVNRDAAGRSDYSISFNKIRENGYLKIKELESAPPQAEIMEVAKKDENETVRFQPGYDKLTLENFAAGTGKSGAVLTYDYKTVSGQPVSGRNYYIRAGSDKYFVLKFTGRRNTLPTLRSQTDAIARSFKLK